MKKTHAVITGSLIVFVSACASMNYQKECSDGLCKITENGKVRYEGSPEKVAAMEAKEKKKEEAFQALMADLKKAPRRGSGEKVRVALLGVNLGSEGLEGSAASYHQQLAAALAALPGVEIVNPTLVQQALTGGTESSMSRMPGMPEERRGIDWSQNSTRAFRLAGVQADFVVHPGMRFASKTGFVSQKGGGSGVVQAEYVEFHAQGTSTFAHQLHKWVSPGKYLKSLAAVGLDKDSKYKKGQMQMTVPIDKETAAIQALASAIHATLTTKIRPALPSLGALREIEKNRQISSTGKAAPVDPNSWQGKLQNMFKK